MKENILIPLRNSDDVHGITPYLETIAKPGDRVIFIVRCSTDLCHKAFGRTVLLEPGLPCSLVRPPVSGRWLRESKKRLAENRILSACANLCIRRVNIEVNAHSGSTSRIVKNYVLYGNGNFVVVRPKHGRLRMFFDRMPGCRGSFKQPAPVLLLYDAGRVGTR
jgi:hypothetical protein